MAGGDKVSGYILCQTKRAKLPYFIENISTNVYSIEELCYYLKENSPCALGQTAPNPVLSTMKFFRDEYIAHVVDHRCPAGVCKALTNFYIDSFLERAALELGFPVERHLSLKHAAALYRQGKLVRKDPLFCCNAV